MMSCELARDGMLEAVGRGDGLPGELPAHLERCADCRHAWEDVSFAARALQDLRPLAAPVAVAASVRQQVTAYLGSRRHPSVELVLAIGFGLLSAALSLAMLGFRLDLRERPPWAVASGAVAWAMTFVLAFWLLLHHRRNEGGMARLVTSGLGAVAVFLVADHLLPLTRVVQFCHRSSWAREHLGVLGLQGVYFAVGAAYALVPLFLLSFATGHRQGTALRSGLVAGGMFFFLLAPAIFIQCSAFTAGALVAWLGGAVVGSTVGGVAGYWVRRHALSSG